MRFKVRYLIEKETEVNVDSARKAVEFVEGALRKSGLKTRVLGAIRDGLTWDDSEANRAPPSRPTAA